MYVKKPEPVLIRQIMSPLIGSQCKDSASDPPVYCRNIKMLNIPFNHHNKHPINVVINKMNAFCFQITQASKIVHYQTSYPGMNGFKQQGTGHSFEYLI